MCSNCSYFWKKFTHISKVKCCIGKKKVTNNEEELEQEYEVKNNNLYNESVQ